MARILVIDDEPTVRRYFARVLDMAGHEVDVAENGREGMRMFRAHRPDLVITDILMPESDGIETITELKQDFPDTKIIAISGGGAVGPHGYLKAAELLGADVVLEKPIKATELRETVNELLTS